MKCDNPIACEHKARSWKKGTRNVELWQNKLEAMLKQQAIVQLVETNHSDRRQVHRAVSMSNIIDVIHYGEVIHVSKQEELLILGYVKTAGKTYRPLHVVIALGTDSVTAITVYDPRTRQWAWEHEFSEKVCFCKKED